MGCRGGEKGLERVAFILPAVSVAEIGRPLLHGLSLDNTPCRAMRPPWMLLLSKHGKEQTGRSSLPAAEC